MAVSNPNINTPWPEWKFVRTLGSGAYGVVYEAVRTSQGVESRAAIKQISIPQNPSEVDALRDEGFGQAESHAYFEGIKNEFIGEIELMETFKGVSNIVSVEDYAVREKPDGYGWDISIRMELLTPISQYLEMHPLYESDVIQIGIDICTALDRCSERNVIHRDIKPANLFVNSFGDYKLGDFGIARKLDHLSSGLSYKGTFNYMAPEIAGRASSYDATVDIYSLGIMLYQFMNRLRLPFLDTSGAPLTHSMMDEALRRRLDGERLPVPCNASPEFAAIILRACEYEPGMRFHSAGEMKKALLSLQNMRAAYAEGNGNAYQQGGIYTNPQTGSYTNPQSNGYVNQRSGGYMDQPDRYMNQQPNGYVNQRSGGYTDQQPDRYMNQQSGGYTNPQSNGYINQRSGGYTDQQPDRYMNQQSRNYVNLRTGGYTNQQSGNYTNQQPGGYTNQQSGSYTNQQTGGYTNRQTGSGTSRRNENRAVPPASGSASPLSTVSPVLKALIGALALIIVFSVGYYVIPKKKTPSNPNPGTTVTRGTQPAPESEKAPASIAENAPTDTPETASVDEGGGEEEMHFQNVEYVGKTEFYALQDIKKYGYTYSVREDYDETFKAGTVSSWSVDHKAKIVHLTVSKGSRNAVYFDTIDYAGYEQSEATDDIESHGWSWDIREEYNGAYRIGTVSSQQVIEEEKKVTLTVSKGPDWQTPAAESETTLSLDKDLVELKAGESTEIVVTISENRPSRYYIHTEWHGDINVEGGDWIDKDTRICSFKVTANSSGGYVRFALVDSTAGDQYVAHADAYVQKSTSFWG